MMCAIHVTYNPDATQWIDHIGKTLDQQRYSMTIHFELDSIALNPNQRQSRALCQKAKVNVVILSPGLLDFIIKNKDASFQDLVRDPTQAILVLCGVEQKEIPQIYQKLFEGWNILTVGKTEEQALELFRQMIELFEKEDTMGSLGKLRETSRRRPRKSCSRASLNSRVVLSPSRGVSNEVTRVLLSFKEEVYNTGSEVKVLLEGSSDNDRDILPIEPVNPYTYQVILPEHAPGIVQLKVLQGGSIIGTRPFLYESNTHQRLELINLFINLLDRVCDSVRNSNHGNGQMTAIDKTVKEVIENQKPALLEYLFSPYEELSDSFVEDSDKELPSLLHFAAKYGFEELTSVLVDYGKIALGVVNGEDNLPSDLARQAGHADLAEFLEMCLHNEEDCGRLYESMSTYRNVESWMFKQVPPTPTGFYDVDTEVLGYDRPFGVPIPVADDSSPFDDDGPKLREPIQLQDIDEYTGCTESLYLPMDGSLHTQLQESSNQYRASMQPPPSPITSSAPSSATLATSVPVPFEGLMSPTDVGYIPAYGMDRPKQEAFERYKVRSQSESDTSRHWGTMSTILEQTSGKQTGFKTSSLPRHLDQNDHISFQTEIKDNNHDMLGSQGQRELVDIMDSVKSGALNNEQALQMFDRWKNEHGKPEGTSFKQKKAHLSKLRQEYQKAQELMPQNKSSRDSQSGMKEGKKSGFFRMWKKMTGAGRPKSINKPKISPPKSTDVGGVPVTQTNKSKTFSRNAHSPRRDSSLPACQSMRVVVTDGDRQLDVLSEHRDSTTSLSSMSSAGDRSSTNSSQGDSGLDPDQPLVGNEETLGLSTIHERENTKEKARPISARFQALQNQLKEINFKPPPVPPRDERRPSLHGATGKERLQEPGTNCSNEYDYPRKLLPVPKPKPKPRNRPGVPLSRPTDGSLDPDMPTEPAPLPPGPPVPPRGRPFRY